MTTSVSAVRSAKGLIARLEHGLFHPPQDLYPTRPKDGEWTPTEGAKDIYNAFARKIIFSSRSVPVSDLVTEFSRESFDTDYLNPVTASRGPDIQLFQRMAKLIDLDPTECVVIEVTGSGVLAARAAGIGTVIGLRTALLPDSQLSAAHFIVEDPSKLSFGDGVLTIKDATVGVSATPEAEVLGGRGSFSEQAF